MDRQRLKDWADARGFGLALAGAEAVESVRKKLEDRRAEGLIDAEFFKDNLDWFRYLEGSAIAGPKVLVIVAVPRPIHILPISVSGRRILGLLPPTYVGYKKIFEIVLADLKANALEPESRIEAIQAPLKSLAAHAGLVAYGRNNITYAPGMGSGFQLCGYLVGMEKAAVGKRGEGEGRESMLARCARCRTCVRACPTGAIREDRFLLSAERCYTLFSESRKPMPSWIRPPKTLCLMGCLVCQQVCPENKGRLAASPSGVEFSAEETEAVREAGRRLGAGGRGREAEGKDDPCLASARAKYDSLGLTEPLEVMGRNIGFILHQSGKIQ